MKVRIFGLWTALLIGYSSVVSAQLNQQTCTRPPECISNSTLNNASMSTIGNMNSTASLMVTDWFVSSGSPSFSNLVPPAAGAGINSIWMWSYNSNGEGIYTCFNFIRGERYRVCHWVTNTNKQREGNLIVRAANNLFPDNSTASPNRTPSTAQLISSSFTHSPTWTFQSYDFVADNNYSQLQLMPNRTGPASSPAEQYELAVDLISVLHIPRNLPGSIIAQCGTNVTVNSNVTQPCATVEWIGPGSFYATGPILNIPTITTSHSGAYEMRIQVPGGCNYTHNFNIMVTGNCDTSRLCVQPPSCIENGSLSAPGTGDMNTTTSNTVPGWYVSHGTPSVMTEIAPRNPSSVWMWSHNNTGEGIFTCYKFEQNKRYRVCVDVMNTNGVSDGNLLIRAANNLNISSYGNIFPASMQLIDGSHTNSSTWITITADFIADNNYNFLQLLPLKKAYAPTQPDQYELKVDNVSILEIIELPKQHIVKCGDDLIINVPHNSCYNYEWTGPGGFTASGPGLFIPNINNSQAGTYYLNITSPSGNCVYTTQTEVIVEGECIDCKKAYIEFEWSGCNPINFTANSNAPSAIVNYYWNFGDGTSSTLANPIKYYSSAGVYEVCLTVVFNLNGETCCKTFCKQIQVCKPQIPSPAHPELIGLDFDYNRINENLVKVNQVVAPKSYSIERLSWTADAIELSNSYNPYIMTTTINELCLEATLKAENGDIVIGQICKPLGNKSKQLFELYPNPNDGTFYIKDPKKEIKDIQIWNSSGQPTAIKTNHENGIIGIKMSAVPPGMYTVVIKTAHDSQTQKIVIK